MNENDKEILFCKEEENETDELICLGCSKGTILFLNVNKMKTIYARFSFHREKINSVLSVFSNYCKSYLIVSVCEENRMKVKEKKY